MLGYGAFARDASWINFEVWRSLSSWWNGDQMKTLVGGLVVGESPRWHDGCLWFSNWGAQEIRTVDLDGNTEVVAKGPKPVGFCIDFLPDGRLLVTCDDRLLRRE